MMRSQQRFSIVSFGLLVLFALAIAVFAHFVSPLRDPSFQPNSANGGSLLPWLRSVRESHWIQLVTGLAGLMALSLTLVLRQSSLAPPPADRRIAAIFALRWLLPLALLWMSLCLVVGPIYSALTIAPGVAMFLALLALPAAHLVGVFWLWAQLERWGGTAWQTSWRRRLGSVWVGFCWALAGGALFIGLQRLFIGYLLNLWLID
jgi:hypothetical protein